MHVPVIARVVLVRSDSAPNQMNCLFVAMAKKMEEKEQPDANCQQTDEQQWNAHSRNQRTHELLTDEMMRGTLFRCAPVEEKKLLNNITFVAVFPIRV